MKTGNYTITYYNTKADFKKKKSEMTETKETKKYALRIAKILTESKEFAVIVVTNKKVKFTKKFEAA